MSAFEDFWLNLRFRGRSINDRYPAEPLQARRKRAAKAFELWRSGAYAIDYDAPGGPEIKRAAEAAP